MSGDKTGFFGNYCLIGAHGAEDFNAEFRKTEETFEFYLNETLYYNLTNNRNG